MFKALFIADRHEQAGYYASLWGFQSDEWLYISSQPEGTWRERIQGLDSSKVAAVYVVNPTDELITDLQTKGFIVFDADSYNAAHK